MGVVQTSVQWRFIDSELHPVPLNWFWNMYMLLVQDQVHSCYT